MRRTSGHKKTSERRTIRPAGRRKRITITHGEMSRKPKSITPATKPASLAAPVIHDRRSASHPDVNRAPRVPLTHAPAALAHHPTTTLHRASTPTHGSVRAGRTPSPLATSSRGRRPSQGRSSLTAGSTTRYWTARECHPGRPPRSSGATTGATSSPVWMAGSHASPHPPGNVTLPRRVVVRGALHRSGQEASRRTNESAGGGRGGGGASLHVTFTGGVWGDKGSPNTHDQKMKAIGPSPKGME